MDIFMNKNIKNRDFHFQPRLSNRDCIYFPTWNILKMDKIHETVVWKTSGDKRQLSLRERKQMSEPHDCCSLLPWESFWASAQEGGQSLVVPLNWGCGAESLGRLRWLDIIEQNTGEERATERGFQRSAEGLTLLLAAYTPAHGSFKRISRKSGWYSHSAGNGVFFLQPEWNARSTWHLL